MKPDNEFTPLLQDLLCDFQTLRVSTERLDLMEKQHEKSRSTARATVEQRLQEVVAAAEPHPREIRQELIQQRKSLLETWITKLEEKIQTERANMESEHARIRDAFETKIRETITVTWFEWKTEVAQSPSEMFDDEVFMKELEEEFMKKCQIEELPQLPGGTKSMAPMAPKEVVSAVAPKEVVSAVAPKEVVPAVAPMEVVPSQEPVAVVLSEESLSKLANQNPDKVVTKRMIVPKDADKPVVQKKVNIFDRQICKGLNWSQTSDATKEVTGAAPSGPVPAVVPSAPAGADASAPNAGRAEALKQEFQRQDTSDLDKGNKDKDTLDGEPVVIEGVTYYKNAKGKLETVKQREDRLAHNSYMRFSRSLTGPHIS